MSMGVFVRGPAASPAASIDKAFINRWFLLASNVLNKSRVLRSDTFAESNP
jgi:hypothetical protein